jgi:hypothetical protein
MRLQQRAEPRPSRSAEGRREAVALMGARDGTLRSISRWSSSRWMTHVEYHQLIILDAVKNKVGMWPSDRHVDTGNIGLRTKSGKIDEPRDRRFNNCGDLGCGGSIVVCDAGENVVGFIASGIGVARSHAPR